MRRVLFIFLFELYAALQCHRLQSLLPVCRVSIGGVATWTQFVLGYHGDAHRDTQYYLKFAVFIRTGRCKAVGTRTACGRLTFLMFLPMEQCAVKLSDALELICAA
jgi:hypothetical protein